MDRINIGNLFPESSNGSSNKPLDIKSLYNPDFNKNKFGQEEKIKQVDFDLSKLINKKKDREKRAVLEYKKKFNMILNKIDISHGLDKTDLIYTVDIQVFKCPEYNSMKCLEFIEEKLRKMYMDTLILSDNKSIFISWLNIEDNKEKDDIEKEKEKKIEELEKHGDWN